LRVIQTNAKQSLCIVTDQSSQYW